MSELIKLARLTQKERAQVIPVGASVQVLYELTDPFPIREGRVGQPIAKKGKVVAYQIIFPDGTQDEWVPLSRLRIRESSIPQDLKDNLKGLMTPWQKEKKILEDPTSLFGGYIRDFGLTTSLAADGDLETLKREDKRLKEIQDKLTQQERAQWRKEYEKEIREGAKAAKKEAARLRREAKKEAKRAEKEMAAAAKAATSPATASPSATAPPSAPSASVRKKGTPPLALPPKSGATVADLLGGSPAPTPVPASTPANGGKIQNPSTSRNTFACIVQPPRKENPSARRATTPKEKFATKILERHKPTHARWMDTAPDLLLATDVVLAMEDVLEPSIFARLQNGIKQSWESLDFDRDGFKAALGECIQRHVNGATATEQRALNPKEPAKAKGGYAIFDAFFDGITPSAEIKADATVLRAFLDAVCLPLSHAMSHTTEEDRSRAVQGFLNSENASTLRTYGEKIYRSAMTLWSPEKQAKSVVSDLFTARAPEKGQKFGAPDVLPTFPFWAAMWLTSNVFAHRAKVRTELQGPFVKVDGVEHTAFSLTAEILSSSLKALVDDFAQGNTLDASNEPEVAKNILQAKSFGEGRFTPIYEYAKDISDKTWGAGAFAQNSAVALKSAMLFDSKDPGLILLATSFVASIAGGVSPLRSPTFEHEPLPVASLVVLRLVLEAYDKQKQDPSFFARTVPSFLSPPRLLASAYIAGCRAKLPDKGRSIRLLFVDAHKQYKLSSVQEAIGRMYRIAFSTVDNLFSTNDPTIVVGIDTIHGKELSFAVPIPAGQTRLRERDFTQALTKAVGKQSILSLRPTTLKLYQRKRAEGREIPWGLGDILMLRAPLPPSVPTGGNMRDLRTRIAAVVAAATRFQSLADDTTQGATDVSWFNLLSNLSLIEPLLKLYPMLKDIQAFSIPQYDPAPRLGQDEPEEVQPAAIPPQAEQEEKEEPAAAEPQEEEEVTEEIEPQMAPAQKQLPPPTDLSEADNLLASAFSPEKPTATPPPVQETVQPTVQETVQPTVQEPVQETVQEPAQESADEQRSEEPKAEEGGLTLAEAPEIFNNASEPRMWMILSDGVSTSGVLPTNDQIKIADNTVLPYEIYIGGGSIRGVIGSKNPVWQVLSHYKWKPNDLLIRVSEGGVPIIRELMPNAWPKFINGINQRFAVYALRRDPDSSPMAKKFAWGAMPTNPGIFISQKGVPILNWSDNIGKDELRSVLNNPALRHIEPFRSVDGLGEWNSAEQALIKEYEAKIPVVASVASVPPSPPDAPTGAPPSEGSPIIAPLSAFGPSEQRQALSSANIKNAIFLSPTPTDPPVTFIRTPGGAPDRRPMYARISKPADMPAFETHLYKQNVIMERKQGALTETGVEEKQKQAEESMRRWKDAPANTLRAILSNPDGYTRNTLGAVYRYALGGCKGTPLQIYNGRYPRNRLMTLIHEILSNPVPPPEASATARDAWTVLREAWGHRVKTVPPSAIFRNKAATEGSCEMGVVVQPTPKTEPEAPKQTEPPKQEETPKQTEPPKQEETATSKPPPGVGVPPKAEQGDLSSQKSNPEESFDDEDRGDSNPMKKWSSWRDTEYPYLSKSQVDRVIPLMKALGVSEVARSKSGFIGAYNEAGSPAGLARVSEKQGKPPWFWWNRREGFNKRHITQVTEKKKSGNTEDLWVDGKRFGMDKMPSRRHLALIAWYWTPHRARFETWLKENGRALAALARGGSRNGNPKPKSFSLDDRPHADSPGWFADYPEEPFRFPITVVKNAERRMKREARETGLPLHIMQEVFRRGWREWREMWAKEDRAKMQYGQPHEHALARLNQFKRGLVREEDRALYDEAARWMQQAESRWGVGKVGGA